MTPMGGAVPQHGNAEAGAKPAHLRVFFECVFGVGLDVVNLNGFAFEQHAPADRPPLRHNRKPADCGHELVSSTQYEFGAIQDAVDLAGDKRPVGVAQLGGRLDQRVAAPSADRRLSG